MKQGMEVSESDRARLDEMPNEMLGPREGSDRARLDELLGPPDGSELNLTPEQAAEVREIKVRLAAVEAFEREADEFWFGK